MPTIEKGDKVLVSGANGYIAMWVVRGLLERGYAVRGTVRSAGKAKFIEEYFAGLGYADKLEIVVVEDITKVCRYSFISWCRSRSCPWCTGRRVRRGGGARGREEHQAADRLRALEPDQQLRSGAGRRDPLDRRRRDRGEPALRPAGRAGPLPGPGARDDHERELRRVRARDGGRRSPRRRRGRAGRLGRRRLHLPRRRGPRGRPHLAAPRRVAPGGGAERPRADPVAHGRDRGDAAARARGGAIGYYDSRQRFIDEVSRLAELGISDVGLYYPLDAEQLGAFETIAREVLPGLRSAYPAV